MTLWSLSRRPTFPSPDRATDWDSLIEVSCLFSSSVMLVFKFCRGYMLLSYLRCVHIMPRLQ